MVWSSGGEESTKNRNEQTNLQESRWVILGVKEGLQELFPDRYNSEGTIFQSCEEAGSIVWGE